MIQARFLARSTVTFTANAGVEAVRDPSSTRRPRKFYAFEYEKRQIKHVFAELKNLRYVDLSNNNIVHILPQAFTSLPLIDTLLLHHNEIERIDKSAFHRVARIETLDLSHNFLKNFTCEQLGSVQTIFNLNLAHNRISQ
ncbi:leucine Rich repeat-containing domain protein [Cooperia oncophora]